MYRLPIQTILIFLALSILSFTREAKAQTVVRLNPLRDNTLIEDVNGGRSNGAGDSFYVGLTNRASRRRGLVYFDVASVIPSAARITSATLNLHVTQTIAGTEPIILHRLLSSWGEGTSLGSGAGAPSTFNDTTWLHRFFGSNTLWSTPGGDFDPTATAQTTADGTDTPVVLASSAAMVRDVQGWLTSPTTNFGWIIVGDEAGGRSAKRIASREYSDPTLRPELVIQYEVVGQNVPEFGTVGLLLTAFSVWCRPHRIILRMRQRGSIDA